MSFLAWMLGLAAYDAVSHAVDASEEAWREADDLRRRMRPMSGVSVVSKRGCGHLQVERC